MEYKEFFRVAATAAVCVVGVSTSSAVLGTLAGGVGANWLTDVLNDRRDELSRRLFNPADLLPNHLADAIGRALQRLLQPDTLVRRF